MHFVWLKTDKLRRSIQTPNSSMQKCSIFLRILAFFWHQFKFAINNNYWNEQKHTIWFWTYPRFSFSLFIETNIHKNNGAGSDCKGRWFEAESRADQQLITVEVSMKRPILWSNKQRIKTIPTTKDSWQSFASPNQRMLLRLFMQVFCSIYFKDF